MSLQRYDEAIRDKITNVYENTVFSDSAEAFKTSAEGLGEGEVLLPLISIYRIGNPLNLGAYETDSATKKGRFDPHLSSRVKTFPITMLYQIDIWSDRKVEVDGIWRELVHFLYVDPVLQVPLEGLSLPEDFTLRLLDTDDTSDVSEFSDRGRLYRQTLNIEIANAKLLFTSEVPLVESIPVRVVSLTDGSLLE